MRHIYNLLLYLILPFLPIRLLWKSRKNQDYRKRIFERFGFFKFSKDKESVWVHAVSVGEALSAVPLIKDMKKHYPDKEIVVTTMTPTGARRIKDIFKDGVRHLYVPYDYPFVVKRFLRKINPKILIIMETELWPNLLHYSAKRNIPVIISNATISPKSFAGYQKIKRFVKGMLDCLTMVLAQTEDDRKKFLALDLDPEKLLVVGNTKFDLEVSQDVLSLAKEFRKTIGEKRSVWIGASTHKGEEEKVLVAAKKILEKLPDTLLILVPRHPERFNSVFNLCKSQGFNVARFSNIKEYTKDTNILLGDVMGKMLMFYGACDIAFVGGSLIKWSGHNLLEPAALAKPVLSGPNLSDFLEISRKLKDANGMIVVDDENELAEKIIALFQNESERKSLGEAAIRVVENYRGVTKKTADIVSRIINEN